VSPPTRGSRGRSKPTQWDGWDCPGWAAGDLEWPPEVAARDSGLKPASSLPAHVLGDLVTEHARPARSPAPSKKPSPIAGRPLCSYR
jgi:hypothetical protein